ncbi:M14 family zinc carboxypeptidase [Metabacillus sp. 84]|uniref:M14 family zinc carboxypeptidase n=1 Tax=unclassified Metabacillus TaxID=2675274 RepID=UPI003CECC4E5
MIKKPFLSLLLSVSLIGSLLPSAALAEEAERKHSLFNSEKYDYTTYDALEGKLKAFQKQSSRIQLDITGKSSSGKNLYTVTISDTKSKHGQLKYKGLRKLMNENPEKAQRYLKANPDIKPPILIHASIHGTEFVGTDAALRLIKRFGFKNDRETKDILKNFTLVINVDANPDGRVDATRFNGNGIDLNRDFITQSQPETKAVVKQIAELNPLVLLDLHGYVRQRGEEKHPGLILPGTPPHNPNYEYDLLYKWMNQQAEAMESNLVRSKAGYKTDLYKTMEGTHIPLRDSKSGWDVYPPIYTPAYAMLHGGLGYTLEAPANDWDGVKWQVDAVTGALQFALKNKQAMLHDQLEVFDRGVKGEHPNNEKGFYPESYIIPENKTDNTAVLKAVQHLMKNDVEVEQAVKPFRAKGKRYEKGTYIVDLNQAKAGLANAFLWEGEDITDDIDAMYDIAAWNLSELWGFDAIKSEEELSVQTQEVSEKSARGKLIGSGPYFIPNTSVHPVHLVNSLIKQGIAVNKDPDGNFYADGKGKVLRKAVRNSGLTLRSKPVPEDAEPVKEHKVAILKDGGIGKAQSHSGTKLALERLGFHVTEIHPRDAAKQGLNDFDTFIYSGSSSLTSFNLSEANKEFGLSSEEELKKFNKEIKQFVEQGGHFIAIGAGGAEAAKSAGLTAVEINKGFSSSNGIVKVDYHSTPLSAGYSKNDEGFVYGPVWFSSTENTTIAASFANEDSFFTAGHWKDRSAAKGQPVIVHEKDKQVTLIGIEAGFRNHTDYLFRLISNAVFHNQ